LSFTNTRRSFSKPDPPTSAAHPSNEGGAAAQKSIGSSHSHSHSGHPFVPQSFFCRPAEVVAPELTACLLVKRHEGGEPLWGVIVETEAYSQDEPATRGYHRRSPSNETLFGEPGRFYV
jgi:hypothetical protein